MQYNVIASQVAIPIHRISKTVTKKKVNKKLNKVSGIYSIKRTHLTKKRGTWPVITNKIKKTQTKRDIEKIINNLTLQIVSL